MLYGVYVSMHPSNEESLLVEEIPMSSLVSGSLFLRCFATMFSFVEHSESTKSTVISLFQSYEYEYHRAKK
jgi:hypothetical protein